jgi:hypothetical protein
VAEPNRLVLAASPLSPFNFGIYRPHVLLLCFQINAFSSKMKQCHATPKPSHPCVQLSYTAKPEDNYLDAALIATLQVGKL